MRWLIVLSVVGLVAAPVAAQVQSRPTAPPIVTAENEAWYRSGQPIPFADEMYYPAGPTIFFNGNTMVRTGNYNGVPLYADATLEPYSIVYVPIGRSMMQPYERPRRGDMAGTTASRTPSFPVGGAGTTMSVTPAVGAPLVQPLLANADASAPAAVAVAAPTATPPLTTLAAPENNDGVWVRFNGHKWVSSGRAVPLDTGWLTVVGQYAGFPVFAPRDAIDGDVIYLPSRDGVVAPYRRKP